MIGKYGFVMVTILTAILVSSLVPSAFAGTWLYYDDGLTPDGSVNIGSGSYLAVKFSLPAGSSEARILKARYYIHSDLASFKVHIFGSDGSMGLLTPAPTVNPTSTGWFDVDLTAFNIVVPRDFYVAMEYIAANDPNLGADSTPPISGRTYRGTPGSWLQITTYENMIRAEVDQFAPVGGVAQSVNKLAIFAPYIALAGLIAAVSTVYVIKRRKD